MSDYELAAAIRTASTTLADALRNQKPKVVVVPLFMAANFDHIQPEQFEKLAELMSEAFEKALK